MAPNSPFQVACPQCGQKVVWKENLYRPFCSERCKINDLGNWASGKYRIPSDHSDETFDSKTGDGSDGDGQES